MKKNLILPVVVLVLSLFGLGSCDLLKKEHNYGTEWVADETHHWHECLDDGCSSTKDKAEHTGGTATATEQAVCEVCGESYGSLKQEEHSHAYTVEKVEAQYLASAATCENAAVYYKSCSCGEKGTETFTHGEALGHAYATTYSYDGTHHWQECTREGCEHTTEKVAHSGGTATCSEKAECAICSQEYGALLEHVYDQEEVEEVYLASAATCENPAVYYKSCVCGAKGEETFTHGEALGHAYSTTYSYDGNDHWQVCTREGCEHTTEKEVHSGGTATETEQAVCEVCNQPYGGLLGHEHDYTIPKYDETGHWNECECEVKDEVEEHVLVSKYEVKENVLYLVNSCECGYKVEEVADTTNPVEVNNLTDLETVGGFGNVTIKLTSNIQGEKTDDYNTIDVSNCVIDLNGHTVTSKYQGLVFSGSNFTIKNGTFAGSNCAYGLWIGFESSNVVVENVTVTTGGIWLFDIAGITLTNVTVDASEASIKYYAVWADLNVTNCVINSGTYKAVEGKPSIAKANSTDYPSNITILGGSYSTDVSAFVADGYHSIIDGNNYVVSEHSYESVVTDPTCTEGGYTTHTCVCGHSYVDSEVDALEHTPEEAVKENENAPTCLEAGSYDTVVYCATCDAEISREKIPVDALGHDYSGDYVDNEDGTHSQLCKNGCGLASEGVAHAYSSELIEKEVTTSGGTFNIECACGAVEEIVIVADTHCNAVYDETNGLRMKVTIKEEVIDALIEDLEGVNKDDLGDALAGWSHYFSHTEVGLTGVQVIANGNRRVTVKVDATNTTDNHYEISLSLNKGDKFNVYVNGVKQPLSDSTYVAQGTGDYKFYLSRNGKVYIVMTAVAAADNYAMYINDVLSEITYTSNEDNHAIFVVELDVNDRVTIKADDVAIEGENYDATEFVATITGEHTFYVNKKGLVWASVPEDPNAAKNYFYLNAGGSSLWDQGGAWFAAWTWGGTSADEWIIFESIDDGIYRAEIKADRTGMKILRMSSGASEPSWNKVNGNGDGYWNNTGDLTIGENNCYTITGWGESDGNFSVYQ